MVWLGKEKSTLCTILFIGYVYSNLLHLSALNQRVTFTGRHLSADFEKDIHHLISSINSKSGN